jgi:hypothetical protein
MTSASGAPTPKRDAEICGFLGFKNVVDGTRETLRRGQRCSFAKAFATTRKKKAHGAPRMIGDG